MLAAFPESSSSRVAPMHACALGQVRVASLPCSAIGTCIVRCVRCGLLSTPPESSRPIMLLIVIQDACGNKGSKEKLMDLDLLA